MWVVTASAFWLISVLGPFLPHGVAVLPLPDVSENVLLPEPVVDPNPLSDEHSRSNRQPWGDLIAQDLFYQPIY